MNDRSKAALVTGGAGGLGGAMAKALAADGVDTLIFDIDAKAAKARASRINETVGSDRVVPFAGDVSDESACSEAVAGW